MSLQKNKFYKEFKSVKMNQKEMVLFDSKTGFPLLYNGIKSANKSAEKNNGKPLKLNDGKNKYYIIQHS